jgi:hypothetical protein
MGVQMSVSEVIEAWNSRQKRDDQYNPSEERIDALLADLISAIEANGYSLKDFTDEISDDPRGWVELQYFQLHEPESRAFRYPGESFRKK